MTTGSSSTTIVAFLPCELGAEGACQWEEMHHYDDEGRHYCPTGFIMCSEHGGIGTIDPGTCHRWGT